MAEDDDNARLTGLARAFIEVLPHVSALGMRVDHVEPGAADMSMPWDERLVGDPATGVIHGGAVSALMDSCASVAVMSRREAPSATATLDLRVDYMRPARPGERLHARAECYHMTRHVAFVRAAAHDGRGADAPVARVAATFIVEREDGAESAEGAEDAG